MQKFTIQKKPKKYNTEGLNTTLTFVQPNTLKVIGLRELTLTAYVLRLERKNIKLFAGQHISLGFGNDGATREYSIYSGENDPFIEVLIKEVEDGLVSKQLKRCEIGDRVRFDGPVGYFRIDENKIKDSKFLFIASGTGIAPFHSFIKSYPELEYELLHGVRYSYEAYERSEYNANNYHLCSTRDDKGNYFGRVTEYLKDLPFDNSMQVYLCGNCDMIHDAYDILLEQGFSADNLHSEVYF
ncbi:MAG: oxidoreductase [Bacteroidetes bacterium HGW-Bacteroidetes-17]|jgi:ferredoxin--NADP+ reductase/benzoate/toluate 1,2-dioxygenase reductase subunit|nr:MAG: oxidoreductase [Bacteroidetes bacterium HGW-Bacteroidetes-17]